MIHAYRTMYDLQLAASVEVWNMAGELVGGRHITYSEYMEYILRDEERTDKNL